MRKWAQASLGGGVVFCLAIIVVMLFGGENQAVDSPSRKTSVVFDSSTSQHQRNNTREASKVDGDNSSKAAQIEEFRLRASFTESLARDRLVGNVESGKHNGGNGNEVVNVPKILEIFNTINELALSGKWDEAIGLLEDYQSEIPRKEMLDHLLQVAMQSNASLDYISKLLQEGASIPENAIITLSFFGRVEIVKHLLSYGLDVYYVDEIGENALTTQLRTLSSLALFKLLVSMNVPTKTFPGRLDALDLALLQLPFAEVNDIFSFISVLLDSGVAIEESHRKKIISLRDEEPEIYSYLIEKVPLLADN